MNKTPLVLGIISVLITFIPLVGPIAGLVLAILAFVGGKKAMAEANARPDRAGIGVAITGKWLGFGGIFQNAVSLIWSVLVFLIALVR